MQSVGKTTVRRGGSVRWLVAGMAAMALCVACESTPQTPQETVPDAPAAPGETGGRTTTPGSGSTAPTPTPSRFPPPPRTEAGAFDFATSGDADFDTWRADFAKRAEAQGRDPGAIYALLNGLSPHPRFLAASSRSSVAEQEEFSEPIWEYVTKRVSPSRVSSGTTKMNGLSGFFDEMEADFGVNREWVSAIWGMESAYGGFIGIDDAGETLASMAVEGRRRTFAEGELIALLKILERGEAERDDLISGWAGAMGQTQFMPSTYLAYAVDFTGDGLKDLWSSEEDALASAANYLKVSGYQFDKPWAIEVALPADFDYALADRQDRRMSSWKEFGLTPIGGGTFDVEDTDYAELWLPAGARGPKLLLFKNFDVFKTYNRADSYALAVGMLGDALAGKSGWQTPWPTDLQPLSVAQVKVLQQGLTDLGYDTRGVDGIAGNNTRSALQRFQKDQDVPADGFPTTEALNMVIAALSAPE